MNSLLSRNNGVLLPNKSNVVMVGGKLMSKGGSAYGNAYNRTMKGMGNMSISQPKPNFKPFSKNKPINFLI